MNTSELNTPQAKFSKILSSGIFVYLFLFQYVTFGLFPSDISPLYLFLIFGLMSITFIYNPETTLNRRTLVALLASGLIMGLELMRGYEIGVLKFLASYFLIIALNYLPTTLNRTTLRRILFWVTIAWFFFTIVSFISPSTLEFLFTRASTDASRGATGLSTEPANWGMASAFLVLTIYHVFRRSFLRFFLMGLASLSCLLSLSMFGLSFLMLVCWYCFGLTRIVVGSLPFLFAILTILPDKFRIVDLIQTLFYTLFTNIGGVMLFLQDHSIYWRFTSFLTPAYVFLNDELFWGQYFTDLTYIEVLYSLGSNPAGINILIIRYGVLGVIFSLIFLTSIFHYIKKELSFNRFRRNFPLYFGFVILFFVGPIAFPMYYLGIKLRIDEQDEEKLILKPTIPLKW